MRRADDACVDCKKDPPENVRLEEDHRPLLRNMQEVREEFQNSVERDVGKSQGRYEDGGFGRVNNLKANKTIGQTG